MAKTLYSQSGKIEYGIKKYVVDTEADKEALNLRTTKMGSKCYVMDTKKWYILNSSNQWVPFVGEGGSGGNGSPFILKGSVPTIDDLPTEDNAIGDLYIVQEDHSEWVWLTSGEESNSYWEQLGTNILPETIITTTEQMTDAQKASTRNNIGAVAAHDGKADNLNIVLDSSQANSSGVYLTGRYLDGALNDVPELYLAGTEGDEYVKVSGVADPLGGYDAANKRYVDSRTFIITVTYDSQNHEYTADKTFAEIVAAYNAGKTLMLSDGETSKVYVNFEGDDSGFTFSYVTSDFGAIYVDTYTVDDTDFWEYCSVKSSPHIVPVAGSTPTITPAANTIYNCGELTSLTISDPPATGAYSIVFTSGSTATTTTIPSTILGLEDFAPEANTMYEINVLDNRAVVGSWAVSA